MSEVTSIRKEAWYSVGYSVYSVWDLVGSFVWYSMGNSSHE